MKDLSHNDAYLKQPQELDIWTDGGCSYNPGEGAVGIVMRYKDKTKEINGYVPYTTNNQMELLAVILALNSLKRPCKINLWTDSIYVKEGITNWISKWKQNNWRSASKKPIKNQKLWQALDKLVIKHQIDFKWIKGHNGHLQNEQADKLCGLALKIKAPLLQEYLSLLVD
ncbi:Ribonuclease HI [Candidatus Hepatincolaceae symbiont of Richtersius coronifer]